MEKLRGLILVRSGRLAKKVADSEGGAISEHGERKSHG